MRSLSGLAASGTILTEQKCKTEVAMETDGIQWEHGRWVWLADGQVFLTR